MAEEVYTIASEMRDAIQAAYAAVPGAPAKYMLQPGSQAGYAADVDGFDDMCCSGTVIVLCGPKSFEDLGNLRAGGFWQTYAIIVLRCAPTVSDTGQMPSVADNEGAVEEYLDDMKVVRTAIRAYLDLVEDANEPAVRNWVEDQFDPSGGCGGCAIVFELAVIEDC